MKAVKGCIWVLSSLYSCDFVLCLLVVHDLSLIIFEITLVISDSVLDYLLYKNKFWLNSASFKWDPEISGFPGFESRSYKI